MAMALLVGVGFSGVLIALNTIAVFAFWPVMLTVGVLEIYAKEEKEARRKAMEEKSHRA